MSPPDLTGRFAQCECGHTVPSRPDLAFFEFMGEGSPMAEHGCRFCAKHSCAHVSSPDFVPCSFPVQSHDFVPHGPYDHDRYYCGCRGWD